MYCGPVLRHPSELMLPAVVEIRWHCDEELLNGIEGVPEDGTCDQTGLRARLERPREHVGVFPAQRASKPISVSLSIIVPGKKEAADLRRPQSPRGFAGREESRDSRYVVILCSAVI
jgi:hypothetical protein